MLQEAVLSFLQEAVSKHLLSPKIHLLKGFQTTIIHYFVAQRWSYSPGGKHGYPFLCLRKVAQYSSACRSHMDAGRHGSIQSDKPDVNAGHITLPSVFPFSGSISFH